MAYEFEGEVYVLFRGESEDGRGVANPVKITASSVTAQQFLDRIKGNPYSFGYVLVFRDGKYVRTIHA